MKDEIMACPCYDVCHELGISLGRWCRFRRSAVPIPAMARFYPEETWCPPGVQATVLMLGHMLTNGAENSALAGKLGEVRTWVQGLRQDQSSRDELDDTSTTRRRQ